MMSDPAEQLNRVFVELQHRYRGLVASFRSRKFIKERLTLPHRTFRSGLQNLMLDARAFLEPAQYRPFLTWVAEQSQNLVSELAAVPVSYDELSGIYIKAPTASLDRELLWITERARIDASRLNSFVKAAHLIQNAVFNGSYESAIAEIDTLQTLFGIFLWSVQLKLALEQIAGGLERQKLYSAQARDALKTGLTIFIAYHTSVETKTALL